MYKNVYFFKIWLLKIKNHLITIFYKNDNYEKIVWFVESSSKSYKINANHLDIKKINNLTFSYIWSTIFSK